MQQVNVLLTTAYWPNLQYFFYVLRPGSLFIEQYDHYQKQSYRNRTRILTANGPMDISIPVTKSKTKEHTANIHISYTEKWQNRHWGAITSAYGNSPYFEYFEDEIRIFYTQRHEKLIDYNLAQLYFILKLLKQEKEIHLTQQYNKEPAGLLDLREAIHPKNVNYGYDHDIKILQTLYYQTFGDKFDFVPNLSILDLVFNTGIKALDYFLHPNC